MTGSRFKPLALILTVVCVALTSSTSPAQNSGFNTPLEIVHNKPFVQVRINGKGPFRFVLDTGTGGEAFITPELAAQLNLPSAGDITLNDPSGKGGRKASTVSLTSLEVGGVQFVKVRAVVHNLGGADGPCQGLLGFALFRNFLMTLDYPNRRLGLTVGALEPDGGHSVLPFRMSNGIPVVALAIGGTRVEAQLDSGGSGLSLPAQVAARLKFASQYSSLSDAHSLSTRFTLMGATLAGDVRFGSYTFKRPFVEINPAFPLANFGSAPMRQFALSFDQNNHLVRFTSQQRTLRLSAPPSPVRLENEPQREAADPRLVPVG
jgi:predicted aspartyl protease